MHCSLFLMNYLDIEHIYLLVRPKRGQGIEDRLKELLSSPVRDLECLVWMTED